MRVIESSLIMTEQTLIQRLKNEEPGAFKELVELYQHRVINTCYRFLFNREDAEDTAQEVFIDVYNAVKNFNQEAQLSTWIYRIAVNRSIDSIRKKKRKKRFAPIKSLLGLEEEGKEIAAPDHWNPEKDLETSERMLILMTAVETLPENQRAVFTLSKCDGVGNKEIAAVMNLSLSSVEALMHRAKKKLRKQLFHYFEKDLKRDARLLFIFIIFLTVQRARFSWLSRLK